MIRPTGKCIRRPYPGAKLADVLGSICSEPETWPYQRNTPPGVTGWACDPPQWVEESGVPWRELREAEEAARIRGLGYVRADEVENGEPWHKWMVKGVLLGIGAGVGTALILWLRGKS